MLVGAVTLGFPCVPPVEPIPVLRMSPKQASVGPTAKNGQLATLRDGTAHQQPACLSPWEVATGPNKQGRAEWEAGAAPQGGG